MKPIATHAGPFQDLVRGPGNYQHLPQRGIALDVSGLLEEVCAYPSRGLTEKFRDIQDAERA